MLKPNSTVTNTLIKARELIADEKNWCKEKYRTFGWTISYCAIGALGKVVSIDDDNAFYDAEDLLVRAARERGYISAEDLNDSTNHPTTLAMFSRAIELSFQEPTPTPAD